MSAPKRLLPPTAAFNSLTEEALLTREQTQALIERVVKMSQADSITVTIFGGNSTNVRFAANQMSTAGGVADFNISVESAYGRKHADGITFHTFRHSMASLALNAGVPEIVVQQMGNWKTASMTRRYAHLADETMRDAAATLASIVSGGQRVAKGNGKKRSHHRAAIAASA